MRPLFRAEAGAAYTARRFMMIHCQLLPRLLLLSATLLVVSAGCSEDARGPESRSDAGVVAERLASGEAGPHDGGALPRGVLLPLELPPEAPLVGQKDIENRYASAVIVKTRRASGSERSCSGVLISPNLVLTAGHCVCLERKTVSSSGERQAIIDGSSCAKTATAATVALGVPRDGTVGAEEYDKAIRHHPGEVRPHPELEILLDSEGVATSIHANLAVIRLSQPVEGQFAAARLADADVKLNEFIIMAGYNHEGSTKENHGVRLFGVAKVTKLGGPGNERVEFEQSHPNAFGGDGGGPCFRRLARTGELVGISIKDMGGQSIFTSTYGFRSWLLLEIKRAAGAGPMRP